MSPRQYSMGARAEAAAKTRAAIVLAARQLHAERGLVATSWDDIADRAGVSKATVYRHFPSLAELVPACAETVFDLIQPLTPEQAAGAFASMDRAVDRYEHIARPARTATRPAPTGCTPPTASATSSPSSRRPWASSRTRCASWSRLRPADG